MIFSADFHGHNFADKCVYNCLEDVCLIDIVKWHVGPKWGDLLHLQELDPGLVYWSPFAV